MSARAQSTGGAVSADVTRPPRLNYERSGSGEPLVLLHGIGSELGVWEPVLGALRGEHEVIAVDLPGFGASEPLPASVVPDPAALAGAVAALLDDLGLQRVHLAGNSLGGWVALELARAGRAHTVVGLCPAGLWGPPDARGGGVSRGRARRAARALEPALRIVLRSERARRFTLQLFVAHPERVPYEAVWRMARSYGRSSAYDATNRAMRAGRFSGPEEIDVPVLLAFGRQDRLIRPTRVSAPGWRTVMLEDCGHIPMWDEPELVAELIIEQARGAGDVRA